MLQVSGGTEPLGDEGAGTAMTARVQSRMEVDGSRCPSLWSYTCLRWMSCGGTVLVQKWQYFGEHCLISPFKFVCLCVGEEKKKKKKKTDIFHVMWLVREV